MCWMIQCFVSVFGFRACHISPLGTYYFQIISCCQLQKYTEEDGRVVKVAYPERIDKKRQRPFPSTWNNHFLLFRIWKIPRHAIDFHSFFMYNPILQMSFPLFLSSTRQLDPRYSVADDDAMHAWDRHEAKKNLWILSTQHLQRIFIRMRWRSFLFPWRNKIFMWILFTPYFTLRCRCISYAIHFVRSSYCSLLAGSVRRKKIFNRTWIQHCRK